MIQALPMVAIAALVLLTIASYLLLFAGWRTGNAVLKTTALLFASISFFAIAVPFVLVYFPDFLSTLQTCGDTDCLRKMFARNPGVVMWIIAGGATAIGLAVETIVLTRRLLRLTRGANAESR